MHPWHDVELGDRCPQVISAVVEIPCGSKAKFEIDRKTGLLRLKEVLVTAAHYPIHYGFIPKTLGTDGDALDVMVLCDAALPPLTIVDVRPIGGIAVQSSVKGVEEKLIAVETSDPAYQDVTSLRDLPRFRMEELEQFFRTYKQLKGEKIEIQGHFEKAHAAKLLLLSVERYRTDPIAA